MRVTESWRTAERGVSAFEAWCTARLWPLVRVPTERDIGLDAFVQVTDDGGVATGDVFGVQVKAGGSYLRAQGAAVDVGSHGDLWREASLPVVVVVHDPTNDVLWWANASEELRAQPGLTQIAARRQLPIDGSTDLAFLRSVRLAADFRGGIPRGLGSSETKEQCDAVWQSFALGFVASNALVALRRVIGHLDREAVAEAAVALSRCGYHPDVFWSERNMLPQEVRSAVAGTFRWSGDEVAALLGAIDPEDGIDRGSIGQCVYLLLFADPECDVVLSEVAERMIGHDPSTSGWAAYLAVARAEDQVTAWARLRARIPGIGNTFVAPYIDDALTRFGHLSLE